MDDLEKSIAVSAGIGFIFGIAKEIYDKFIKKTYFDCEDLFADFVGIVTAVFSLLMIYWS
jgi:hypothetical protein